jgi:hypothetical protein
MGHGSDWNFINFVQMELRAGKTRIKIPAELLQGASEEAMNEAKALVKLSGAKIVSVDVR